MDISLTIVLKVLPASQGPNFVKISNVWFRNLLLINTEFNEFGNVHIEIQSLLYIYSNFKQ